MVEGNTPAAEWQTYTLKQLQQPIEAAKEAKKYLFIWDKQGSVATFMNYKANLCDLAPEVIKVGLGRQENSDVAEFIRKSFIGAMREGDTLCLNIDKTSPDFADYHVEGTFNPELFFKYEYMDVYENYMPFVRESENHGIGGLNPGCGYARNEKFGLAICVGYANSGNVDAMTAKIPNFQTDFQHCIIE